MKVFVEVALIVTVSMLVMVKQTSSRDNREKNSKNCCSWNSNSRETIRQSIGKYLGNEMLLLFTITEWNIETAI